MIEIPIILGSVILFAATREVFFKKPQNNADNNQELFIITDQYGEIVRIYNSNRIINSDQKINNYTTVFKCDDENIICPLTQEKIPLNTEIRKLKCNHLFTKDRIDIWLRQNNTCPICRENIID